MSTLKNLAIGTLLLFMTGSNEPDMDYIKISSSNNWDRKMEYNTDLTDINYPKLERTIDNSIMDFLEKPFSGFKEENLNSHLGIIALSNISEGLYSIAINSPKNKNEVLPYLQKTVSIGLHEKNVSEKNFRSLDNLYLAHLNIVIGKYALLSGDPQFEKIHEKITRYLFAQSMNDSRNNPKSYKNLHYQWPADQAALLYSLHLFDEKNSTKFSDVATEKWLNYVHENATHKKTGLPYSELSNYKHSKIPRGCALSWTIKYLSDIDRKEAESLWDGYKENFFEDYILIGGFREYPRGVNLPEDSDSGPIIMGIGTSATALGLAAANKMNDYMTSIKISYYMNAGKMIISFHEDKNLQKLSENLLSKAIEFSARNSD